MKGPGKRSNVHKYNQYLFLGWPGIMRTVFGDSSRFKDTYFSQFPGYFFTFVNFALFSCVVPCSIHPIFSISALCCPYITHVLPC